ncbi:S-layer homology domain-containing protein [Candidatus Peregrinibacteria bacterium]|nr:S-layer homology domain-containing protein [Candidatus Peregrinibacteria bacterium]
MFKRSLAVLLLLSVFITSANAFIVNKTLADQVDTFENTVLDDENVVLDKTGLILKNLFINPNFPTERDMYLSTESGVYLNRQYNADFNLHTGLTQLFPNGFTEIKFEGTYSVTGIMLAYDKSKIYVSNNRGDTWIDETPVISEDILFANFGPKYAQNQQIYFITSSGLYRMNASTLAVAKLVTSTEPGSVKNFRFIPTQSIDDIFYVVNGDTLLKTENYGSTWIEHKFSAKIRDFEIKQKTLTSGHLMVLTEGNEIFYATDGMNFYKLTLPAEITTISAVDYIILTNAGFYITYNNGETWTKLNYPSSYTSIAKDYDFVVDGNSKSLYLINGNTLYRDTDLNEVFNEYMSGLDATEIYKASGTVISKNLLDLNDEQFAENYIVEDAFITSTGELNGQTIEFFLTADGINWEPVNVGIQHTFENKGRDLRWKAVLSTTNAAVTPILKTVSVDFGLEKLSGCAGFPDINVDDPRCPAIEYVKKQGIFIGYPDGNFQPDNAINRAETVKVIIEGFNTPMTVADGTNLGFSDVEIDSWYMGYLKTAKQNGIIEGYPDGTFKPSETVIYVEMLKIFFEGAGVTIQEDAAAGTAWYQKYVDYASSNNLIPYNDVSAPMKRADVAQLFYEWSLL